MLAFTTFSRLRVSKPRLGGEIGLWGVAAGVWGSDWGGVQIGWRVAARGQIRVQGSDWGRCAGDVRGVRLGETPDAIGIIMRPLSSGRQFCAVASSLPGGRFRSFLLSSPTLLSGKCSPAPGILLLHRRRRVIREQGGGGPRPARRRGR